MRTIANSLHPKSHAHGFSLIEIIVSIIVTGILMTLIFSLFDPQKGLLVRGTDPLYSMRAAELGQSYLEEILGKRFDENSPSGNNIRCNDNIINYPFIGCTALAAFGVDSGETAGAPGTFDDVDDYTTLNNAQVLNQDGSARAGYTGFLVSVAVNYAGSEISLVNNTDAKRIDVTITDPRGVQYVFSAYKTNF